MTREQHIVWDPSLCIEFDSKNSLTHHFSRREPLMRFINDLQMSFTRIIFQIETQTQRNLINIGTKIRTITQVSQTLSAFLNFGYTVYHIQYVAYLKWNLFK